MIDRRFGWRICLAKHADLSGTGGLLAAGRWHSKGRPVIYMAEHPALAAYELVARTGFVPPAAGANWVLLQVDLGDLRQVAATAPAIDDVPQSRAFGDAWIASGRSAILEVPSARIPVSTNLLLNPRHPAAAEIGFTQYPFRFDISANV